MSECPCQLDSRRRKLSEVYPASPDPILSTENLRSTMEEIVAPLKDQIKSLTETLTNFQQCQEIANEAAKKAAEDIASSLRTKINDLEQENKTIKSRMTAVEKECMELKERIIYNESQSRRSNLRFHGIKEYKEENCIRAVNEFLVSQGFPDCPQAIERAHRLGPPTAGKIRPIIARFVRYRDRQFIWDYLGYKLFPKSHNVPHIREDFPKEIEERRSTLLSIASAALRVPLPDTQDKTKVSLVVDRLHINNNTYTTQTLHKLPENLKPSSLFTPSKDGMTAFFTKHSPLSNHYACNFTHEGISFNCMEQCLMVKKAKLFKDNTAAEAIMSESNPAIQKKLGKGIRNFDKNAWESKAEELLIPALEDKFKQCQISRNALLQTGTNQILEANPQDLFWGVGASLHSEQIWNIPSHKGRNMLGKCLQLVRSRLRKDVS